MTLGSKIPSNLSIVMPYYNEEANVRESIAGALEYLRGRFEDFEIVAVDDHSTDATLSILEQLRAGDPRIRIVALEQNTKFAGALKAGFAAASKEYVFYTDGDCPIDYRDIDRALERLGESDVVVGYRTTRDREGFVRKLYTNGYRLTLRVLLGINFRDVNFSFKLFPKRALDSMTIESDGSFIDAEILYKLRQARYRIAEIPVHYHSRRKGSSTLASPMIIVRIFRELLAFRATHHKIPSVPPMIGTTCERNDPAHRQRG